MPGVVLRERYHIEKLLHRGRLGGVYKSKDLRFPGRWWKVKEVVIFPQYADFQDDIKKRFLKLAQQLTTLSHAALPKIVDYFHQGLRLYLVTEYIEGRSIEEILERYTIPFSEKQAVLLGLQLVDLVSYLAGKKGQMLIVPDLKPTNMLITSRGEVKLVDFSLSQLFEDEKVNFAKVVSMGYGAPELYKENGRGDERSWIYSIGVLMHQMMTRRSPEEEPFVFPYISELNPFVSNGTADLAAKATDREVNSRFDTLVVFDRELKQRLQAIKSGKELPPVAKPHRNFIFTRWKKFILEKIAPWKDLDRDKNMGEDIPLEYGEGREMSWQQIFFWAILIVSLSLLSLLGVYLWYLFKR